MIDEGGQVLQRHEVTIIVDAQLAVQPVAEGHPLPRGVPAGLAFVVLEAT